MGKKLLVSDLANLSGSPAHGVWGLTPADTGDTTNPAAGTKLVLDKMFDPKSLLSQMYLKEFCDILFEQKFAWEPYKEYVCPINRFDKWLKEQSTTTETPDPDYVQYCGNANEIPVPEEDFHLCFSTWAINAKESSVVSRDGIVEVMYIKLQNSALFSDSYDVIDEQFNSLDTFMTTQNQRNTWWCQSILFFECDVLLARYQSFYDDHCVQWCGYCIECISCYYFIEQ